MFGESQRFLARSARSLVAMLLVLYLPMITDMKQISSELAEIVQPIGVSNLEHDDAPVVEGSNGTTVDPTALGNLLACLYRLLIAVAYSTFVQIGHMST